MKSAFTGLLALMLCTVATPTLRAGQTIHVNAAAPAGGTGSTWDNAFNSLTDALAMSQLGDDIWIAEGTYKPGCPTTCSFVVPSETHLYGGFGGADLTFESRNPLLHPTILSGDILGDDSPMAPTFSDNTTHIVTVDQASGVILDGLTIVAGYPNDSTVPDGYFGGYLLAHDSELFLNSCQFPGELIGNAVAVYESNLTCTYCELADAGYYVDSLDVIGGEAIIDHCRFLRNGGLSICASGEASITVTDCLFLENYLGVRNTGDVSCTYDKCLFLGNGGKGALASVYNVPDFFSPPPYVGPLVSIVDSVFVGNKTDDGCASAIDNNSSHPTILRCTFVGNAAALGSGAIRNSGGSIPTIRSSILWGNTAGGVGGEDAQIKNVLGAVNIANSDVEGWSGKLLGVQCIGEDPRFENVAGEDGILGTEDDDYRLLADSPCVDRGDPSDKTLGTDVLGWPLLLDGDLDGQQRVDMGAVEFGYVGLSAVLKQDAVQGDTYLVLDVSGPASMQGQLLVGSEAGLSGLPPYGALLFDPAAGWMRYSVSSLPFSLTANVTPLVGLVGSVTLQALGLQGGVGNLSNAVTLDLTQ